VNPARLASLYGERLASLPLALPHVPNWAKPSWHLFVIGTPERNALQQALQDAGIQTLVHYPIPPHLQRAYADLGMKAGSLPISERLANQVLSLPIGPQMSLDAAEKVAVFVVRSFGTASGVN